MLIIPYHSMYLCHLILHGDTGITCQLYIGFSYSRNYKGLITSVLLHCYSVEEVY